VIHTSLTVYLPLLSFFYHLIYHRTLPSFPTRRSSDLFEIGPHFPGGLCGLRGLVVIVGKGRDDAGAQLVGLGMGQFQRRHLQARSEEHTSELQSRENLVCRLLLEKKKSQYKLNNYTNC